jgi:hypothetical protein
MGSWTANFRAPAWTADPRHQTSKGHHHGHDPHPRTPEQIVSDFEAKIAAVKAPSAAKQAKASPEGAAFLVAARALQKAQAVKRHEVFRVSATRSLTGSHYP